MSCFRVEAQPLTLLNVDFRTTHPSGKVGPAAIGQGSNDFWNSYQGAGHLLSDGRLALLSFPGGETTQAALSVFLARSTWWNGSSDPMYQDYVQIHSVGSSFSITLTNFPTGSYDIYLYSHDGNFRLVSGGVDYGVKRTLDNPVVNPTVWQEGRQYAVYRNVAVSSPASPVLITVRAGSNGYPAISGMQIAQFATNAASSAVWRQPVDQYVTVGSNFTLQVLGVGLPSPAYQWFLSGAPLTDDGRVIGAISNTLSISGAQSADAGDYQVVLTNIAGAATSSVAVVRVGYPPTIVQQPLNQTAFMGQAGQFFVQATGDEPLTYQWYHNGTALTNDDRHTGVTMTNLAITDLVTGDAGNYTVQITNVFGFSTTSSIAVLSVKIPADITLQPLGASVPVGMPYRFAPKASGAWPLYYQWLHDGVSIPNATNLALAFTSLLQSNFGDYQLIVTNGGRAVTSSVATLTKGNVGIWGTNVTLPKVSFWPDPGLTNVIGIAAYGIRNLALREDGTVYSWAFDSPPIPIAPGWGIVDLALGAGHELWLCSNGTVQAWGLAVPSGLSNVVDVTAGNGWSAALRSDGTVVCWGNIPPPPADLRNVQAIDGGNLQALALQQNGRVVVWGDAGSLPVPLGLKDVVGVSAGPSSQALNLAVTAGGAVHAWGAPSPATNVPPNLEEIIGVEAAGGNIIGSSIVALAIRANRTVRAWGICGGPVWDMALTNVPSGLSNVVSLAGGVTHALALVDDGKPLMVRPPVGGTFYTGRDLILRAKVVGNSPLSFQWLKDGNEILGETNESIILPTAQFSAAGSYQLVASNALGIARSVTVPVTVVDRQPALMSQPVSQVAYYGSPFSIGASVIGSGPVQYVWLQNGTPAFTGTNDLVFEFGLPQHAGSYQLIASNAFGSVTSSVAQITFRGRTLKFQSAAVDTDGWLNSQVTDESGGPLTENDLAWLQVQASTNLTDWESLSNSLLFTNGLMFLQDEVEHSYPVRFYRFLNQ